MQHIRKVLILIPGVFGLFLFIVCKASAENLYHWKGQNGAAYFSNIAPADDATGYSVIHAVSSDTKVEEASVSVAEMSDGKSITAAPVGPGSARVSGTKLLRERIRNREASIHRIEALLRADPKDSVLRKRLYQKIRCLHEDIIRLEATTN